MSKKKLKALMYKEIFDVLGFGHTRKYYTMLAQSFVDIAIEYAKKTKRKII